MRKVFGIRPSSYVVTLAVSVAQDDRSLIPTLQWGPALGNVTGETTNTCSAPRASCSVTVLSSASLHRA